MHLLNHFRTIDSDQLQRVFTQNRIYLCRQEPNVWCSDSLKDGIVSKDEFYHQKCIASISSEDDGIIWERFKIYSESLELNTMAMHLFPFQRVLKTTDISQILEGNHTVTCNGDGFSAETNFDNRRAENLNAIPRWRYSSKTSSPQKSSCRQKVIYHSVQ